MRMSCTRIEARLAIHEGENLLLTCVRATDPTDILGLHGPSIKMDSGMGLIRLHGRLI